MAKAMQPGRGLASLPKDAVLGSPVPTWGSTTASADVDDVNTTYELAFSKYNPTPGTGRTGFSGVAPNNYPFYSEDEKYTPIIQADGGQLSEWKPMYNPTKEEAEQDRAKAYESGVPHGYVPSGQQYDEDSLVEMWVCSNLHTDEEYGEQVRSDGRHYGGPFKIKVSADMRIDEVRKLIRDVGGIPPALQKLSYAGKVMKDSQRTLKHYGVAYWHPKFPHWPLQILRR